jgi:hypothetical protein
MSLMSKPEFESQSLRVDPISKSGKPEENPCKKITTKRGLDSSCLNLVSIQSSGYHGDL